MYGLWLTQKTNMKNELISNNLWSSKKYAFVCLCVDTSKDVRFSNIPNSIKTSPTFCFP